MSHYFYSLNNEQVDLIQEMIETYIQHTPTINHKQVEEILGIFQSPRLANAEPEDVFYPLCDY